MTANPATRQSVEDTGSQHASLDLSAFAGRYIRVNLRSTIPQWFTGPATLQIDNVILDVQPVNLPPVLSHIGNQTVNEGQLLQFGISGTDPNGNALTYSVSNPPSGASFDLNQASATFNWTPGYDQAGTYSNIVFRVTDTGGLWAEENITITVNNVNQPPTLGTIGPKTASEGLPLTFGLSGSDPDADPVTYAADVLPSGASLNPSTGTFSWTPGFDQAGVYMVTFRVTDSGSLSAEETVAITVNNIVVNPVADFVGDPNMGTAPLTVHFSNMSAYTTGWSWDFGDSSTSTEQNPSQTYSAAGTYTVTLTATGYDGLTSQKVRQNYIGSDWIAVDDPDYESNQSFGVLRLVCMGTR